MNHSSHGNIDGASHHNSGHFKDGGDLSSLILAFQSEAEIEQLTGSREAKRLKVNVRNALGVRHQFFNKSSEGSNS